MSLEEDFNTDMNFEYGEPLQVSPGIRRVVANNPGPMTFNGTNSYIVGQGDVALIDPGPDEPAHIDALLKAISGERISHIFLTHTHIDHSGALPELKARTGALTCGFTPVSMGRGFASLKGPPSTQFIDLDFMPDRQLADGDYIAGSNWRLEAVHTPGHAPDHLCFALAGEKALFAGDHVMGWNTSVIGPPEGNMKDYIGSLEKLLERDDETFWPAHGGRIKSPGKVVKAYIVHRHWRESSLMRHLQTGSTTIAQIVPSLYKNIDKKAHGAAALSVLAQLEYLVERGRVMCEGPVTLKASYKPAA